MATDVIIWPAMAAWVHVLLQVQNGHYRIVFTTPETFYEKVNKVPKEPFMKMARDGQLCGLKARACSAR